MRTSIVAAVLLAAGIGTSALAQGKRQEDSFRYLAFSEAETGDQQVALDGVVQYRREAGSPGAWMLDVCFPRRPELTSFDRFAAPASVNREVYTASGRTSVDDLPASLRIETRMQDGNPTLKGELRVGAQLFKLAEQPARFRTGIANEGGGNPASFGSLMPNELSVKVPMASLRALLDVVRREKAVVLPNQLVPGCSDLREGAQYVRLQAPPRAVKRLAAALKGIADTEVRDADGYPNSDGVALPAGLRGEADDVVLRKLAATIATVLGAEGSPEISARPGTGESTIVVTRQTETAVALGLREAVAVTALVVPDVGKTGETMLYVTQVGSRFVDPSATPLALPQDLWENSVYTDLLPRRVSLALINAFAREIGGEARPGTGSH